MQLLHTIARIYQKDIECTNNNIVTLSIASVDSVDYHVSIHINLLLCKSH